MISINNDYKDVLKSDEQQYNAYIVLDDGTMMDVDMSALKIIYNLGEKIIGNFSAKRVELASFDTTKYNITNKEFEVFIGLKVNTTFNYLSIGKYKVEKPVSKDEHINENSIIAIDYSFKFKQKYIPVITFPCTIENAIIAICNYLNVNYIENNFINKNYMLEEFYIDEDDTFFDVIKILVESAFANAFITSTNSLIIKSPSSNIIDYEFNLNELFEVKKEDNKYGKLNSIVASRIVADDGSTTEDVYANNENSIELNGLYEYKIIQNEAIDYDRQTAVNNILNGILDFEYNPAEIEAVYNPALEIGDMLKVPEKTDTSFLLFAKEIVADLSTGLMTIKATEKTKTETDYKSATNKEKRRKTELKINKLEGKIVQLVQETNKNSEKISKNEQDIDSINQTVSSFTNFTKTVEGTSKILLEDALETNILKLVLYAENTENGIFPGEDLFPSEDLFPENAGNEITILVENADKTESKEFYYNCTYPLEEYNGVHDQLVIEFDKEKGSCSVKVLAYIEESIEGVITVLSKPKEIVLEKNLQFVLFKGNNHISIKEYQDWNIEATYIFNNELNDLYATQVYMSSVIKQLTDEILLEVSKKVGDDELISKINLTPETIKIIASKLALEGYTTINGGFSIDEEGNASIANGAVVINSNGIRMADGTSILGGKGLLTNLEFVGHGNMNDSISGNYYQVGFRTNGLMQKNFKAKITIDVYIPENFTIESAYVVLSHFPLKVQYQTENKGYGYARKVKLYKSDEKYRYRNWIIGSEFFDDETGYEQEILSDKLTENGWTSTDYADEKVEEIITEDIKNNLSVGNNRLILQSSDKIPNYVDSNYGIDNQINCALKTGMMSAILQVFGYMKPYTKGDEL